MKIFWYSRHPPVRKEVDELKKLFGNNIEIIIDKKPVDNVDNLIKRFREQNCDEIVAICPYSVLHKLSEKGIKPLFPIMKKVEGGDDDYDLIYKKNKLKFIKFVRIEKLKLETSEIKNKEVKKQ